MLKHLMIRNSILINASIDKIWDALVNPEQTKKYMFGCETVSDWKVGSELLWQYHYEGKDIIAVKGSILAIEPGHYLAYTTFDPHSPMEDVPQNYLTVTYELREESGQTRLNVTQGNYAAVADGQRRYKEAYNNGEGWMPILIAIKHQVEEGK